jgi:hypothetical protein
MSETKLSKAIFDMIQKEFPQVRLTRMQCGIIMAKHGAMIHCAAPGWPDYIGYLPNGRIIGIEVKAPASKTKVHRAEKQEARRLDIIGCGGVGLRVESVDECRDRLKEVLSVKSGNWTEYDIEDGLYDTNRHWQEAPGDCVEGIFGGWLWVWEYENTSFWNTSRVGVDERGCVTTNADKWLHPLTPTKVRFWVEE